MVNGSYPFIDTMCRLCLKENGANVNIFTTATPKETMLSIPIRIMSCAALEVQENDSLPKAICTECRYQLEKSFYFRKRSQLADSKLRKHLRLISLGKKSRVFIKTEYPEEEDDEEMEFEDSLRFIHEQDEIRKEQVKAELHDEIEKLRPSLRREIRKELNVEMEEKVYPEMRKEIEINLRKELRNEMKKEIRDEIRTELEAELRETLVPTLREECRETEVNELLSELERFLRDKRAKTESKGSTKLLSLTALNENRQLAKKKLLKRKNSKKLQYNTKQSRVDDELKSHKEYAIEQETSETNTLEFENSNAESNSGLDENDNDNDSNNYYIIDEPMEEDDEANDTDEGQAQSVDDEQENVHVDVDTERHEEDDDEALIDNELNNVSFQLNENNTKRTISYQITDDGRDEATIYKRKDSVKSETEKSDREDNIVILNFEQSSIDEEHLDMVEFVNLNEKVLLMKQKNNDDSASKLDSDSENSKRMTFSIENNDFKQSQSTKTAPLSNRTSDTPKIFKCQSCPSQFSTENSLNRHLRTHAKAGEKGVSFQCPDCGIFVSCKSALTRHMIIHSGVKPFVCEECGKSFIQREILKRHMQTHTGAKPYKCKHCTRSFAQKANLVQHINKNHLEVPIVGNHPCPLCPKRFNHSSGLSRHLATHSGVTFQCTECERTFADRSSVKRHIANMHPVALDGDHIRESK